MFEFFIALLVAAVHWLRGWSPVDSWREKTAIEEVKAFDDIPAEDAPLEHKAAHYLTQDYMCGAYIAGFMMLLGHGFVTSLLVGLLYFAAEFWFIKRLAFASYNGNISEYNEKDVWYKKPIRILHISIAAGIEKFVSLITRKDYVLPPRLFAATYTSVAGLAFATALIPILSFSYDDLTSIILCTSMGACYFAMNLIPNRDTYGETIARGIYGIMLGIAL